MRLSFLYTTLAVVGLVAISIEAGDAQAPPASGGRAGGAADQAAGRGRGRGADDSTVGDPAGACRREGRRHVDS